MFLGKKYTVHEICVVRIIWIVKVSLSSEKQAYKCIALIYVFTMENFFTQLCKGTIKKLETTPIFVKGSR